MSLVSQSEEKEHDNSSSALSESEIWYSNIIFRLLENYHYHELHATQSK